MDSSIQKYFFHPCNIHHPKLQPNQSPTTQIQLQLNLNGLNYVYLIMTNTMTNPQPTMVITPINNPIPTY